MRKFWLLQFIANALILFAFYEWLGVRDSRASQLILSFVLGAAIIVGTVLLHSRTFHMKPVYFAGALLIFLLLYWGLSSIPFDKAGLWIASTITYRLRKPVKPDSVVRIFNAIRWILIWLVIPLALIRKREPKFWIQYIAVVVAAFVIPAYLIHWTPKLTSTALQVTSFVVRWGIAYCLITTGFVSLWRFTSPGSPVESQPNTAPLP